MHASLDIPPYFYIRDRAPVMAPTETVEDSTSVGGDEGWNRIQGALWRGGNIAPDFKHHEVTPRFAAEAVKVIESHDGRKPLFLYLALPSPHTPWLPAREFDGKSDAGMYGDFVMTVDAVVWQVLASLDKAGMSDNTLVLFSSDNGPVWYDKDVQKFGHRSTGPLRGAKASVWEGGHRMPFIVRWPGRVKAGTRSDHLVAFTDVFATFAELAGQKKLPPSAPEDSVSFLPALLHPDRLHETRPRILHGERAIRDGDWKLISTKGSRGFTAEPGQEEKRKTGSLYGVVDLDTSPVDETSWFEIRLRVEGKRIQVFVEGMQVVDYTEPPNPDRQPSRAKRLIDPEGGALAIQAHDPGSVFYFKQIRIRELD